MAFVKKYRFGVLGDKNVGKTAFCSRFLIDFFPNKYNDFI
jgi:GTPase SAR1 family protein